MQKEAAKILESTKDHIADLMAVVVEKFDDLQDNMERGFIAVGEKFEQEQWETPASSPDVAGPSNTPRRPDKSKRFNKCPFCRRLECRDPTSCGFKLKWSSRITIHKKEGLCIDRCCYKRHTGRCNKLDSIKCTFCGRKHLALWCILKAKQDRMV